MKTKSKLLFIIFILRFKWNIINDKTREKTLKKEVFLEEEK